MRIPTVFLAAVITLGLCSGPDAAVAQNDRQFVEASGLQLVTPAAQSAIDRGLRYLSKQQNPDGSFGSGSTYRRNVAVTALCGMAFLADGHAPGRGPYGKNVGQALDFILRHARPNGYIIEEQYASHGPMYGHGFATLFLAEVYGMSSRKDVRETLEKAVRLIVNTQNSEGGWRYDPEPTNADVSVTVCQMMALRAARNAGVFVPKDTVDRCVDYITRCQNSDGGFRYQLEHRAESRFPRSAAAVVALYNAGVFKGPAIERGIDYLDRHLPDGRANRHEPHYMYGHYYAVQAMWHAGGDHWTGWYPAIRDELIERQSGTGAWPPDSICPEYGTAMACLVLQVPNNYLPIFQR
ncbi:MAG: terpene cyclase/mutase family protein [Planctomycetes bacterium]|nr:terpene cyclase/mutase family protein [Planctomycetota bacterium]